MHLQFVTDPCSTVGLIICEDEESSIFGEVCKGNQPGHSMKIGEKSMRNELL